MMILQVFHNIEHSSGNSELVSIIVLIIILWALCDGNLNNIFGHDNK